jgi:A predicted alpha-helical domain with a conserved ER motif.
VTMVQMVQPKPLLSRVADAVYWMARYIERAENVARSTRAPGGIPATPTSGSRL